MSIIRAVLGLFTRRKKKSKKSDSSIYPMF
ncbi:hypothetical protein A8926_4614 [Saccharopolyspora spinosa]|uniref:Uncharacterized protein n=1 Tax=Saccharopolyspora spinosa TaxID=60894 RepID=A0A2N3Y1F6_SACSN|nr:hypothetical protein A8926_4614 [Saccharopolyspora spinosa]